MALSCDFGDMDDPSEYSSIWEAPTRFARTPVGRRKRCRSCREPIPIASDAVPFTRWRVPLTSVELDIYGEEGQVPLAPHWHCETCGGLALSLLEHGYSIDIDDDMRELAKEHAALVRIVGDAPCRNALLGHDLSLVRSDTWERPNVAMFVQVERVTKECEPGWHGRSRTRSWDREHVRIECHVSSFAAFEGVWQMIRGAHPLPEGWEWRVHVRTLWAHDEAPAGLVVKQRREAEAEEAV